MGTAASAAYLTSRTSSRLRIFPPSIADSHAVYTQPLPKWPQPAEWYNPVPKLEISAKERTMKKVILSVVAVFFTACQAITWAESPAPPVVAFDILKADIDLLLKNSPPAIDQQIRVVD